MNRAMLLLLLFPAGLRAADEYPSILFKNAHLSMTVLTPDAKKGFYRGSRFDWSGVIRDVKYNNHIAFAPWKATHDPANHDDITGPSEEFRTPLGYAEAKEGEQFLKIGVGTLVKPKEKEYRHAHNYEFKYPGQWEVIRDDDAITFKQGMLTDHGYGYKYVKTLRLADRTAGFTIQHELTNAGTKAISTEWYNHNFFNINGDGVGPNCSVHFPFTAKAAGAKDQWDALASLEGTALIFSGTLEKGTLAADVTGFGTEAAHHGFTIYHKTSRVSLTVKGDEPLSQFRLWGTAKALCPEPYIRIQLQPGESKTWSISYKFVVGRNPGLVK